MIFSILHTSARPEQWRTIYDAWMQNAAHRNRVEYVLCIDPRWGFSTEGLEDLPANITVVQNTGRRCYVDGVNLAARASSGDVLIVNADDQYPCDRWDIEIEMALWRHFKIAAIDGSRDFAIRVSVGVKNQDEGLLMPCPILSRARYEKLGYVFYPQYESMYADNDFCEHAMHDGMLIDAMHLTFPHHHWVSQANETRPMDEVDQVQNRKEAYALGKRLLERRRAAGFGDVSSNRSIALCFAGEHFEGPWVDAMLTLVGHLYGLGFTVLRVRPQSWTNVYISREAIRRDLMNSPEPWDIALWLDDDNLLSPAQFDQLLSDLDAKPEVDGVAAWCWIHQETKTGFIPSCGEWAPDHLHWRPFPHSFAYEGQLKQFDVGGLPCLLMRRSALEKAGEGCFLPILDSRLDHGITGEDISFFRAAEKGGCKFLVDPTVRIPHLKYVTVDPVFREDGKVPVKVACMMRVKNEARWIARTIESVKALCGSDIYVMEDGSTDDTAAIAERAGAVVLPSPFASEGFSERRDKNWLLEQVVSKCKPDWIFMPDGDEELEPGGCEKLRRVLESNPPVDVFGLRFLYFWNGLDQVRLDGQYGTLLRRSLFRPVPGLTFESYYQGKGENDNHVGLHVSNAPGVGFHGLRDAPLQVFLYHYGYVFKEDRIRKFQWIIELDPHNEKEDCYRHTIQGDGPVEVFDGRVFDIPADWRKGFELKHAGPLDIQKLPARMVPNFEVMPQPLERESVAAD
jgi:Glycosyl transferase family 2